MSDTQADQKKVDSQREPESRWTPKTNGNSPKNNGNPRNPTESDRSNDLHSKSSSRGKRGGRPRGFNPRRVPRGPAQKNSDDEDESLQIENGEISSKNLNKPPGHQKISVESSEDSNQSASSQSDTSEEEEEEEDDDEEEEDDDEKEEKDDEKEEKDDEKREVDADADKIKQEAQENHQAREQTEVIDIAPPKHNRGRNQIPEHENESQFKSTQKRQPYVRQVELPKEKLSAADLEAKMAAMALKNAQLMEQKKAADQDAAEYREIELKSQQVFEAQRDQQREIDAVRQAAAERKLKKSQGREWDFEKTEDDWNRSRPYTDSMTNPNPGKNSWYASRGSGYRGRPGRGPHNSDRGTGRGGKRGGRGGSSQGKKPEYVKPEGTDQSQPTSWENSEPQTWGNQEQDQVPASNTEWY